MQKSLHLELTCKDYKILDQLLAQASGYPIKFADEKFSFPRNKIINYLKRVNDIIEGVANFDQKVSCVFLEIEVFEILRTISLVFIETGPSSDLSTVTGYSALEVESLYNKIDRLLAQHINSNLP